MDTICQAPLCPALRDYDWGADLARSFSEGGSRGNQTLEIQMETLTAKIISFKLLIEYMQRLAKMRKESQWLTIGQAADYLGVSRDTLRRWEKKGKIKAIRSPSNRRYYTKTILDAVMDVKEVNQSKTKLTPKTKSKVQQLIIIGILSFAVTIALAITVQFFLLK